MPIHEFISFKPTEVALTDPTTALAPAIKFFSKVDGCSGLYFGVSEEDKDVAFIVIVWETYEHHKAVIDSPGYPGIVGLAGTIAGNSTMLHVHFREAPEPALCATTTEVAVMTLKPGKTLAALDEGLESLVPLVGQEEGCEEQATWGVTKEDKEKIVVFCGWASAKRHYEIGGQAKYKPHTDTLVAIVDVVLHHAPFTKFV